MEEHGAESATVFEFVIPRSLSERHRILAPSAADRLEAHGIRARRPQRPHEQRRHARVRAGDENAHAFPLAEVM